jgi:hypothetical protein
VERIQDGAQQWRFNDIESLLSFLRVELQGERVAADAASPMHEAPEERAPP